jgi:hypothetical protein
LILLFISALDATLACSIQYLHGADPQLVSVALYPTFNEYFRKRRSPLKQ